MKPGNIKPSLMPFLKALGLSGVVLLATGLGFHEAQAQVTGRQVQNTGQGYAAGAQNNLGIIERNLLKLEQARKRRHAAGQDTSVLDTRIDTLKAKIGPLQETIKAATNELATPVKTGATNNAGARNNAGAQQEKAQQTQNVDEFQPKADGNAECWPITKTKELTAVKIGLSGSDKGNGNSWQGFIEFQVRQHRMFQTFIFECEEGDRKLVVIGNVRSGKLDGNMKYAIVVMRGRNGTFPNPNNMQRLKLGSKTEQAVKAVAEYVLDNGVTPDGETLGAVLLGAQSHMNAMPGRPSSFHSVPK